MTTAPVPAAAETMFVVDTPLEVARWRPLVNWILVIPHLIILGAMRYIAGAVGFIYWVALIITGRLIPGLYGFLAMYQRYEVRAESFLYGFNQDYAPFDFGMGGPDNGAYPGIRVDLPEAPPEMSRVAALNVFLAIPHYIVLIVIGIGAAVVSILGWFAVLFTGAWPEGWRAFLIRFTNYYLRVWAYAVMTTREYPRFGL